MTLCSKCWTLTLLDGKCQNSSHVYRHRGSFFDLPVVGVIIFGMVIGIIITYMVGSQIFTNLPAVMQTGIPATYFNVFLGMNGLMDGIMVVIFVMMGVASAILARQIQSPSPAFWAVGLLLIVVLNFVWVSLANIFIGFVNSGPGFAAAAQAFPYTSFIIQNYPIFMIFQAGLIAWAQWGKPSGTQSYYS